MDGSDTDADDCDRVADVLELPAEEALLMELALEDQHVASLDELRQVELVQVDRVPSFLLFCPNLQRLAFFDCASISDDLGVLRRLDAVEELVFEGCGNVALLLRSACMLPANVRKLCIRACLLRAIKAEMFEGALHLHSLDLGDSLVADLYTTAAALSCVPSLRRLCFCGPDGETEAPIVLAPAYRAFLIVKLPQLTELDWIAISASERADAPALYGEVYEDFAWGRAVRRATASLMLDRRLGMLERRVPRCVVRDAQASLMRPTAAEPWVHTTVISHSAPRQFEYAPLQPDLLLVSTMTGEVHVVNHLFNETVARAHHGDSPVLGLSWLRKHPTHFVAGSPDAISMYDVSRMARVGEPAIAQANGLVATFELFGNLTSCHANATDELLLATGYANDVKIYDMERGACVRLMQEIHSRQINVAKFASLSPSLMCTSSFDRTAKMWDLRTPASAPVWQWTSMSGNVMVCFAPDDSQLLLSAIDNEVHQLTLDGRLLNTLPTARRASSRNYTRSYYMRDGKYIVVGSCLQSSVRLHAANTGRIVAEIELSGLVHEERATLYVQSLRGDPHRDFELATLVTLMPWERPQLTFVTKHCLMASGVPAW